MAYIVVQTAEKILEKNGLFFQDFWWYTFLCTHLNLDFFNYIFELPLFFFTTMDHVCIIAFGRFIWTWSIWSIIRSIIWSILNVSISISPQSKIHSPWREIGKTGREKEREERKGLFSINPVTHVKVSTIISCRALLCT